MASSDYEQKILVATRRTGIATLVAALIEASGRSYSRDETIELFLDLEQAIYPEPSTGTRELSGRLSP
jgi:hypothetical protein